MTRNGGLAFLGSSAFFAVYGANVGMGAYGSGVFLSDVSEMLMLFASMLCFVIGILQREAAARNAAGSDAGGD